LYGVLAFMFFFCGDFFSDYNLVETSLLGYDLHTEFVIRFTCSFVAMNFLLALHNIHL